MIRFSYMEPRFKPEIGIFRLFSVYWMFFVWDGMAQSVDASQRGASGGCMRRAFHAAGWGLEVLPQEFYCKYKLRIGHFWAFFKGTRKKAFRRNWEECFSLPKKGWKCLKGFPGRPVDVTSNVEQTFKWPVIWDALTIRWRHSNDPLYFH